MEILVVPLLSCGIIALRLLIVDAATTTQSIFNPFTGNFDYITQVSTQNFVAGPGGTVTCTNGVCTFGSSGTSKIIATYISSGNFQTSSANSTFIPCPPYSSTFSVTSGDFIYITLTVQIDTNQAGGQFHADLFQDATNLNGGGATGGGWLQVFNPNNRELQTASGALWFKPSDTLSHNYQLKFNSPNGGTVFCGNTDDYWIAQEIQVP